MNMAEPNELQPSVSALAAAASGVPDMPIVSDINAHRGKRQRRLLWSIGTSFLVKPLSLLVPLVTTPLFLKYLGPEGYGLFAAVASLAMFLTLINSGLAGGLVNRLVECEVAGDRILARRYMSSLMITLFVLICSGIVIWSVVAFSVNWSRVFSIGNPNLAAAAPWVVLITGVCTMLCLLLGSPQVVAIAHQEVAMLSIWDGIGKIASVCACVLVVYTRWGLIGVAVAVSGTQLLSNIALCAFIFARRPWLAPHPRYVDRALLRRLVGDGFYLFLVNVAILLIFQCDKLIIANRLGAAAVTEYDLVGRLFLMMYGVFVACWVPLGPAYAEALRRGDIRWVQHGVRLCILLGLALSIGCGIALLVAGDYIFAHWTRNVVNHVPRGLILAITATFVLRVWVDSRSIALNAINVLRAQAVFIGLHAILNLAVALILSRRFGVQGVAWATPLTALLTTAWGYPWLMRQHLPEYAKVDERTAR